MTGTATTRYVFAVCHRRRPPDVSGLAGHANGTAIRLLPAGPLAAVVQPVPAEDFTEDALQRRLADHAELERCARAHHDVVTAVARQVTTVPLPLATLYLGDDRARQALTENAGRFLAALDRIEGRSEWGVKVYAAPAEPAPPAGAAGSGRTYLERLRRRQQERSERREAVWQAAEQVYAALGGAAVAARRLPAHGDGQVLNAAYLVDTGRERELTALVTSLSHDPAIRGAVRIETTGPWVPYSFVQAGGADGDG